MCTIAYGNQRGSSWEAREKYTFRGVHVSRSSSIHHPCIAFERHLLEGSDQASLIPRRGLSWRLRGGDPRVSLRGAQNALTAALELCAIVATLRTLESSPWVDADPRTARVRCARRLLLLLLAAVGASAPPATLLLLTALLRWALLLLLRRALLLLRDGGRK